MKKWKMFRARGIQLLQGTWTNVSSQKKATEPKSKTQATWLDYHPHS